MEEFCNSPRMGLVAGQVIIAAESSRGLVTMAPEKVTQPVTDQSAGEVSSGTDVEEGTSRKFYVTVYEHHGEAVFSTWEHGFGEKHTPNARTLKRNEKVQIRKELLEARKTVARL